MYTKGKWIYNKNNCSIESSIEYLIEPDADDDIGIPVLIISTFAAMGGNDIQADINLICQAPAMLDVLQDILFKYDITTGGINTALTLEEIDNIKSVVNAALGN